MTNRHVVVRTIPRAPLRVIDELGAIGSNGGIGAVGVAAAAAVIDPSRDGVGLARRARR